MSDFETRDPRLFEAFIKAVQYMVGMTSQDDIQDHLGRFFSAHFPAEWVAFVENDSVNGVMLSHFTFPDSVALGLALDEQLRTLIADVFDSGFLAAAVIPAPDPSMTVLLPVFEESKTAKVLMIGHKGVAPLPKELLDIYLAVAGLAGTAFERLRHVQELARHRSHLEELVKERTAALEAEIAERKEAQRALFEEHERLSVTLGSIGDGVIATDVDRRVVMLNPVAQELTGWTDADAKGRSLDEVFNIVNEATGERAVDPVARALKTGTVVGLANHTALIARDGSVRSIADSCAPIRTRDGAIVGAVLVFRDVTGEKIAARMRDSLNDINASINSTLEFDEIMWALVVEAAQAVGCEAASIEMRQGDYWEVNFIHGLPAEMIGMRIGPDVARAHEAVINTKRPFLINGNNVSRHLDAAVIEAFGIESMMLMPVMVKDEVVATLRFVHQTRTQEFTAAEVDFATKLAASLSLALENARLYAAERHIAETLQESLLFTPEEIPGISFNHLYNSATEAARVGGDFYDAFEIEGGRVGIVIGDVAGKGVAAAAMTVFIRSIIKSFAKPGRGPAGILEMANGPITRAMEDHSFVTVFLGILDTGSGELEYASAGHPPALLKRAQGGIEPLIAHGPVIGAFSGLTYSGKSTRLFPGDMLVLYTDGAIEARSPDGGFFGRTLLAETLSAPRDAAEMPGHIFERVIEFTGGGMSDDIAILAISLQDRMQAD